jgi:hypothetical protein
LVLAKTWLPLVVMHIPMYGSVKRERGGSLQLQIIALLPYRSLRVTASRQPVPAVPMETGAHGVTNLLAKAPLWGTNIIR